MESEERIQLADVLASLAKNRQDDEAWKSLYKGMWPFIWTLVFRRLHGLKEAAEDASQEVFVRLLKSCPFDRLRDPEEFRAYTYTVAVNVSRNYMRLLRVELKNRSVGELDSVQSTMDTPEGNAERNDLLREIFGQLDERDQQLLKLLIEGYSLGEIASQLGLSYRNAAVRVHRIRKRLQAHLDAMRLASSQPSAGIRGSFVLFP
jgi:RNA polymerase sigma-70 factor (ECF subfamily)